MSHVSIQGCTCPGISASHFGCYNADISLCASFLICFMEDPWANAWGTTEPAKSIVSHTPWAASAPAHPQDTDDDLGASSWATRTTIRWTEPSDIHDSLWNAPSPGQEWTPSLHAGIPLGKASGNEPSQSKTLIVTERLPSPFPSSPTLNSQAFERDIPAVVDELAISHSPTAGSHPPIMDSPDAFGTFETGLDETDVDPWAHSDDLPVPASDDSGAWVPTWREPKLEDEVRPGSGHVDEWETVKQGKERQEDHVVCQYLLYSSTWPNDITAFSSFSFNTSSI